MMGLHLSRVGLGALALLLSQVYVAAVSANVVEGDQTSGRWRPLGPFNSSGPVLAIAAHPSVSGLVYAGFDGGGVWRSDDAGENWRPVGELPCTSPTFLALDRDAQDRIWVAMEDRSGIYPSSSHRSCGMAVSADGGATWTLATPLIGEEVRGVAHDPITGSVIVAASNALWRSSDGGLTYRIERLQSQWHAVVAVPGQSVFVAAGSGEAAGLVLSEDGGENWQFIGHGHEDPTRVGESRLAATGAEPVSIYWSVADAQQNSYEGLGLWRSSDGASTFNLVFDSDTDQAIYGGDILDEAKFYGQVLAVDPADAEHVLVGGRRLYESLDGGNTFTNLRAGRPVSISWTVIDRSLWAGYESGPYLSHDGGLTYEARHAGLATNQVYRVTACAAEGNTLMVAADQETLVRDSLSGWVLVHDWLGDDVAIDPDDPGRMYVVGGGNFRTSSDGGRLWTDVPHGAPKSHYRPTLLHDVAEPGVVWQLAYSRLNRISGWGAVVEELAPPISTRGLALDQALSEPNIVMIATSSKVTVSTSSGVAWLDRSGGLPSSGAALTDVAIHPSDGWTALLTAQLAGYDTATVFRTTNLGGLWEIATAGLPDESMYAAVIEGEFPWRWFVGGQSGVFVSHDEGLSWEPFKNDLARVAVHDLEIHRPSNLLRAATRGQGVWEIDLRPDTLVE